MTPELHGRVRTLFDEALDRPEADRLPFVQSACSDDAEVFQAVVRLLEAHRSSPSFLEDDSRTTGRIGRYVVTGELGRGAMGVVYEAVDPLIGRKVAVKVIHLQAFADAGKAQFLRDRLSREARAAGALSHPGIVTVFDVGHEGDLAFIAMECVDGPSLLQLLGPGQSLPYAEALEILRQAGAALDYAHRNGVVHRDIKPANVMLDKGVAVKVADFGIAKIASMERQTLTTLAMGTPSYMSPEQVESLPSDGRSDQFSLAVVAYELLTGRRPFEADSLPALAHMIVYAERPSARNVNPSLPAAVDVVFRRSLARTPSDRYPTCTEFVIALEKAAKGEVLQPNVQELTAKPRLTPVSLSAASGKYRGWRSIGYLAGGGATLLALLLGAVSYKAWWPNRPLPQAAAPMVNQFLVMPQSIASGSTAILQWDVTGATEVVLDQGIGKVGAAGTFEVSPPKAMTYVLTATGPGGKKESASAFVKVTPPTNDEKMARADRRGRQLCADAEAKWHALQSKQAIMLFRQAATMGNPQCMDELGEIYMDDEDAEAFKWFRKAAEAGNPSGMLHVGAMYYLGKGASLDYGSAAYWYREADKLGNTDAAYNLGTMYENGQGVAIDLKRAAALYIKAAAQGNAEAKDNLKRLNGNNK
jgi:tRNA A-37 threonylcarbamoyl transferase component Bud32